MNFVFGGMVRRILMLIIAYSCIDHSVADSQVNPVPVQQKSQLTLESIMSDPDWMGNSPERALWALDGQSIYFQQKATGHTHRDSFQIVLKNGKSQQLGRNELVRKASAGAMLSSNSELATFEYKGDLYLFNNQSQEVRQLTADSRLQSSPQFVDDNTISYLVGHQVYLLQVSSGLATQIAEFKTTDDPDKEKDKSYLEQSQPRLLETIKAKQQEKDFQKQREKNLSSNKLKTWYLGKDKKIKTFRLSPNAKTILVGTVDKELVGKSDHMPEFVTEDGYVKDREVRDLVGTSTPMNEDFFVFNLQKDTKTALNLDNLPAISDDPLNKLRKQAAKKIGYKYKDKSENRAVYAYNWSKNQGVEWSKDSEKAAILLFSYDNKSRWIVTFDVNHAELKTAHWMTDDAWVNDWTFNEFGWLPDNQTLYYLSEEDGYSHLYIKKGKRKSSQLTEGKFEVSDLTVSKDGRQIFYKANERHPGIYEIYRYDLESRSGQAVTNMGGTNTYVLSPDEKKLLITHSTTIEKPELFIQDISTSGKARQLTHTMSESFKQRQWQAPEIVAIDSSHVSEPIYSRLYKPQNSSKNSSEKRPAVMFVHGAGYLQNSHQGWSGYFREFMFHNYLTEKGYVVLDMDYRASKGYGRDWRTAIYRNMGTPELQDLQDGTQWLVDNMNVDPKRIGVYGGSYGGFMTFMAMFKEPELFAAGAALRPVTDWSHYNHGYTSNILNTPQVDPDAFERSSPIEFAKGLNKPLLIAHGMVDDNVFFKDSVRLVQKLIELKKTKYFETAIYPVEPHGFREPTSWLDEYTRIDLLFERTLN